MPKAFHVVSSLSSTWTNTVPKTGARFRRITAADVAIADLVEGYDDITEHRPWLDTPEGQASLAVLEEVYAFCRASQAEFDATDDREDLEDVPWLPPEMSEVIKVAFGCPPPE